MSKYFPKPNSLESNVKAEIGFYNYEKKKKNRF